MVLQHERYVACRATTADSSHKMCALSFVHWLNFLDAARSDILMPLTWSGHQTLYHAAWSSCLSDTHTHRWSYKGICIISSSKVNKKLMGFWPNWPVTIKQYLLCSTSSLYIHIYAKLVEAKWIRSSPCGNRTLCWFSSRNPARGHAAPWSASGHRSRTLLQYPRTRISVLVQKFNYETMNYYCVH